MTGLSNLLSILGSAPKECLYALVNEEDKRIQIGSTSNFIAHISKLAQELGSLNNRVLCADLGKLKLLILETEFRDRAHRKNRYREIHTRYKNLGWSFYSDTNITKYKLKTSYKSRNHVLYYVIELESNKRRLVVGVFKTARDARSWKQTHYPDENMITGVVVCDNEETKSW